ncbi:hypothetical protein BpHYR1_004101, partial [Brachionus plicatilis]
KKILTKSMNSIFLGAQLLKTYHIHILIKNLKKLVIQRYSTAAMTLSFYPEFEKIMKKLQN